MRLPVSLVCSVIGTAAVLAGCGVCLGATLPAHRELRILIVSDEVNPHGLPPEQLTQPGELGAALAGPSTGLNLSAEANAVLEIPTDSLELATAELTRPPSDPLAYDVLLYFAHRIPNGADGVARQESFTDATRAFLERGGGLVAFHHGLYVTSGKEGMAFLMGGAASGAVSWNTVDGQNVIAVAPAHFVTCSDVSYDGSAGYEDVARGVPVGNYPFFNNTPDERYLQFDFLDSTEEVEILFGSDFNQNGSSHLLGFTHRRSGWSGLMVGYQPGESQPTALDPAGANFQVLVNAIVYAAHRVPRDGIGLSVEPGLAPGEVSLAWSACPGSFVLFRSPDAAQVGQPGTAITATSGNSHDDDPPAGAIQFYRITRNRRISEKIAPAAQPTRCYKRNTC